MHFTTCQLVEIVPSSEGHSSEGHSSIPSHLPMVRRDINLTVRSNGIHAKEEFVFLNKSDKSITTTFKFPSERCRVHGLRFKVDNDEWKVMKVEEKVKAQATHDHAMASGHQSVIAKTVDKDIFSIEIGRLESYQIAIVELHYLAELDWIGFYSHRHQLTSSPAYIMDTESLAKCQEKMPKLTSSTE